LEKDVKEIGRLELEEKEFRVTELKANKAEKMILHHDEIMSRPKRTWFQSHHERLQDKAAQRLTKLELKRTEKKVKKTLTPKDRVEFEMMKAAAYAARVSKKQQKDKRIRACAEDDRPVHQKKTKKVRSSFSKELTSTGTKSLKKYRRIGSSADGGKKMPPRTRGGKPGKGRFRR